MSGSSIVRGVKCFGLDGIQSGTLFSSIGHHSWILTMRVNMNLCRQTMTCQLPDKTMSLSTGCPRQNGAPLEVHTELIADAELQVAHLNTRRRILLYLAQQRGMPFDESQIPKLKDFIRLFRGGPV
ncbi:hypothetical protein MLD38_007734 [Melastoma candidum]|uniref:Uncharacterized protein n=1 Tax=Melastoma candidum TaxID=119954 RepID=A0ACB9RVS9_9MYRT|nr:hypothetical protein MLD38_007734 [Melastoma candidum]